MIYCIIPAGVLLALLLVWFIALRGQKRPQLQKFRAARFAHRGLHDKPAVPENSRAAFLRAVEKGYGSELDVHLLKDGGLAVIHDALLVRTTGAEGKIEDLTVADLKNYRLEGTYETIPTLQEVLHLYEDSGLPLLIELKAEGNCGALCQTVCDALAGYGGAVLLESFDPRCLLWLRRHRPEFLRGQLVQNFCKHPSGHGRVLDFLMTALLLNGLTRPDFVAYRWEDRRDLPFALCRKVWKTATAAWTITTRENFEGAVADGSMPIFETFDP